MSKALPVLVVASVAAAIVYFALDKRHEAARLAAEQAAEIERSAEAKKRQDEVTAAILSLRGLDDAALIERMGPCVQAFDQALNESKAIVSYQFIDQSPTLQISEQMQSLKDQINTTMTGDLSVDLYVFEVRDGFSISQVIGDYRCDVDYSGDVRIVREGELDISDF